MKTPTLASSNAVDYKLIETHVRNAVRRVIAMAISPLESRVTAARNKREESRLVSAAAAQL